MTNPNSIRSPVTAHIDEPLSPKEKHDEDAAVATVAAAGALRVAPFVLIGLLVCPPLAILAFLVIAPLLVMAVVLGLVVAVLSAPYLLIHHFRGQGEGHLSLLAYRLRRCAHAFIDLAPHRIVADVRRLHSSQ